LSSLPRDRDFLRVRRARQQEIVYDPPLSLRTACAAADRKRVGERSANYVNSLYPLSDISIITKYFLGA
jgi:hypothetical protein